ncbi:MAG: endolytic transglycosylase MltG [Bacteroidales bacterium]|nr:endolytic transglycosylase MltG [Bacteroidales bacterium]
MRKKSYLYKAGLFLMVLMVVAGITVSVMLYRMIYAPNVFLEDREHTFIFIPTGSTYEEVKELLQESSFVVNMRTFDRLAQRKNYPNRVMPGRYLIQNRLSNNELINLLRSGAQTPVRITFTNIRTEEELAGNLAAQLEVDSLELLRQLRDPENISQAGLSTPTIKILFIPNTYEVYWTISASALIERMQREYQAFWTASRRELAERMGLNPEEVVILASIVQSETNKSDEMPRIAGVYVNRLRRNIPLQADPTVVYALGDFSINRVLNEHLAIDSPYNTYKYRGLPPGPINLPEPATIDAVLNFEEHDYIYFSASPDFSGYHVFARTYREHLRNARLYQQALNERRIFR